MQMIHSLCGNLNTICTTEQAGIGEKIAAGGVCGMEPFPGGSQIRAIKIKLWGCNRYALRYTMNVTKSEISEVMLH
ncbi:hypothetical protein P9858_00765 [Niallia circulans]|uniref:hypothetical protein n=1 Tax=Niallia circulans TaxID=1397 RepID=UPI002E1E5AF7|nr:hypothetical protein [Niallia circulans]